MMTANLTDRAPERGMTLFAVMAVMTVSAMLLLAAAPMVRQDVTREKEIEAVYRGEEVAEALRQYVEFYRGAKLPTSMDDLVKGLPQGTKDRAILRRSAAIDPLSEDGKWRLIQADPMKLQGFARRLQSYNGGMLPSNPSGTFDRYTAALRSSLTVNFSGISGISDDEDSDSDTFDDDDYDVITDGVPFIGVASQSQRRSMISYYGIEKHSSWVFTPLFRGNGRVTIIPPRPNVPPVPIRTPPTR